MTPEMEVAVNAEVERIEREYTPDDLLLEVRQHLILATGDYATPVCDSKIKTYAEALLAEVTPALEGATPEEVWHLAKSVRDAFRAKLDALKPERAAEFQRILALREPWRTRGKTTALGACSAPESILPTSSVKIDEIF